MTFVKINDRLIEATISGLVKDSNWNDRESKAITCALSYQQALELFTNDVPWFIVYQSDSETEEYDNSEYCLSGAITDNRDGTITIKMGKLTELEETLLILYGGVA
jgi:hypothetical protein